MNILDHRILIPKSPQIVWEHLSDLSKNQSWQVNYASLSFLTSKHSGNGTRWRYTTSDGHEYVAEITVWYEGLGYEYTLVDGVAFRENKGRIRLQEIPEGTIVQWTFSYDIGGFLGGVRNALTFKRQLEGVMVDSLKMLWRVLNQASDGSSRESKAILRAGLDYEARAQYKPRHPSAKPEEANEPMTGGVPAIVEPPISDEDTRPRKPVVVEAAVEVEPDISVETTKPGFLAGLPEAAAETMANAEMVEIVAVESEPTPPSSETSEHVVVLEAPPSVTSEILLAEEQHRVTELVNPPGVLPELPVIVDIEPERADVKSEPEPARATLETRRASQAIKPPQPAGEPKEIPVVQASSFMDQARLDTSEVSVFELFGVQKPSQTQEMQAVGTQPVTEPPAMEIISPPTVKSVAIVPSTPAEPLEKGRTGLRVRLRRKRVRARRPG